MVNRFVYKNIDIMHSRDCPYLQIDNHKEMTLDEVIIRYNKLKCCKKSRSIVLIHNGIKDMDNCELYYNFFINHRVSTDVLKKLFVDRKAKLSIIGDYLEIKCNKDSWRIAFKSQKG